MRSQHLLDDNIDIKTRTLILNDGIDEDSLDLFLKGFALLGAGPITIKMNSGGGDVVPGLAMVDLMEKHRGKITVEVWGQANSMAAIILQAADVRKMSKNSSIMVHQGVEEPPTDIKKNIKSWMKLTDELDSVCDQIVLKRVQKKHPKYSWTKFREETQFDLYFNAAKALELGLVDRII